MQAAQAEANGQVQVSLQIIARLEGEKSGLLASVRKGQESGSTVLSMQHQAQIQSLELTYKDEAISRLKAEVAELKTSLSLKEERIENLQSQLVTLASRPSAASSVSSEQQSLAVVPLPSNDRRRMISNDIAFASAKKKQRLSPSVTAGGFSDQFSMGEGTLDDEGSEEQAFEQSVPSSTPSMMMFPTPSFETMAMLQFMQQQQFQQGRGARQMTPVRGRGRPKTGNL